MTNKFELTAEEVDKILNRIKQWKTNENNN